ncbi:MAG: flagellar motor switch protein FliM [Aquificota bacterium]|jgi:flagellar motor switch protein FliM|uniref:Flagellar motor switch protein FliM n=1 Tax=Hydrogenobacter sp. TaxID=2152829 RepID=A0A7C2V4N9_9AQUI|nr:MAG: flagellar motor switch protein FliM [Aquificota bacterium]
MADELLSQEEINLLLQTLGKEEKKEAVIEEEKIKPLDLTLFEHISAGRIAGLELIFERWINGLRKGLTSLIVTIPDIFKESVNIVRFGDFVAKLPLPCAVGIFNIEPLRGQCLIAIDPRLIYIVISSVFGGSAKQYKIEGKEFTRIEMRFIQRLLNLCYQELELAWSTVMKVRIVPINIETNPTLLTVSRAKEKFILLKLTVIIEGSEGYIYLAIPEASIAPYKDMLKGTTEIKSKSAQKDPIKAFQKIPLKLEVLLGGSQISFKRLLELKQGDVIILDKSVKEPLEVKVEGLSKFLAFLGQLGRKKAIKIYKHIQKED